MLINYSNHENLGEVQYLAALELYGSIQFEQVPHIDPNWEMSEVKELAKLEIQKLKDKYGMSNPTIMLAGEQSYVVAFYLEAVLQGLPIVVSTSDRITSQNPDGSKNIVHKHIKFRNLN